MEKEIDLFAHAEMFALFRDFWNYCKQEHPEVFDAFMKVERENNLLFDRFMKAQKPIDDRERCACGGHVIEAGMDEDTVTVFRCDKCHKRYYDEHEL